MSLNAFTRAALDDAKAGMSDEERRVRRAAKDCARLIWSALPVMRVVARDLGYALAVHGSQARDVDLIAVPWVDEAGTAEELRDAILGALVEIEVCPAWSEDQVAFEDKPHGRRAVCIATFSAANIDLSVIPRDVAVDGRGR